MSATTPRPAPRLHWLPRLTVLRPRLLDWLLYAGVALTYGALAGVRDPFVGLPIAGLGALVALGCGAGILVRAFQRPERDTVALALVATAVLGAAYMTVGAARDAVGDLRFRWKRDTLESVVREALANPRIETISAGGRYYKFINWTAVRGLGPPLPQGGEPPGPPEAHLASEVLAREGISHDTYRAIRSGLLGAGYLSVTVREEYVLFIEDGMLDNEYGVLWVRPGHQPPAVGPPADARFLYFVVMRPLGDGWYEFVTT